MTEALEQFIGPLVEIDELDIVNNSLHESLTRLIRAYTWKLSLVLVFAFLEFSVQATNDDAQWNSMRDLMKLIVKDLITLLITSLLHLHLTHLSLIFQYVFFLKS